MGSIEKESSQEDSKDYEKTKFEMNILVCGNYDKENIENELEISKSVQGYEGNKYNKTGKHRTIPEWEYFFFDKDKNIGENTYSFIEDSILNKSNCKNLILFYTGLEVFTFENLLNFYDGKLANYHPNILIITKKDENIKLPNLKNLNNNFIRICKGDNIIEILINMIEIASFYNQLGDEIGYPKKLQKKSILDKDNFLATKYLFTLNILLCGKPGAGKSTLINQILGKEKSFSKIGNNSITKKIIKYIHEKYPITLYDTPGFETEDNISSVEKLIIQKNASLDEEKNRIHCIFYVLNRKSERGFLKKEYPFLLNLIKQKMDIFIITTHAESKENSEEYIEATKIYIHQNSNNMEEIKDLKKYIFPVELKNENNYKRFGLTDLFNSIYQKYKKEKVLFEINEKNMTEVNSKFLKGVLSEEGLKKKLTALSLRVKYNFKLLSSTVGNSTNAKTTMLTVSVIKIISNIYNHKITTEECLKIITQHGYTNELTNEDTLKRKIEKGFAHVFYFNGPASKEVNWISEFLIDLYNKDIDDDANYYLFLNNYRKALNEAIESLKNINDN